MRGLLLLSDKIKLFPRWIITLLPLRLLLGISNFLFLIFYYLIPYRKNVVVENLRKSFVEKKANEINRIAHNFNLAVIFMMVCLFKGGFFRDILELLVAHLEKYADFEMSRKY
jgi:lauroyl/myristoyl acyltransferase